MSTSTAANKAKLLEELRKTPIVSVACQRANIGSRTNYYRWIKSDKKFAAAASEAIDHGTSLISEMAESQLISAIKEKNMSAIMFWLRHHAPAYETRVKVDANITNDNEELTPEQAALVKKALRLANLLPEKEVNNEKS